MRERRRSVIPLEVCMRSLIDIYVKGHRRYDVAQLAAYTHTYRSMASFDSLEARNLVASMKLRVASACQRSSAVRDRLVEAGFLFRDDGRPDFDATRRHYEEQAGYGSTKRGAGRSATGQRQEGGG